MTVAPIILFTYNRPWHTEQTLKSLASNYDASKSELIVYVDGPKAHASPSDRNNIDKVKELVSKQTWCKKLTVHISETNNGLANSIIRGVSETLKLYDRVIVLEDDIILSLYFLQFMNEALIKYQDHDEVICIHGYCLPIEYPEPVFFLKGADCWGWATWQRGWKLFNPDSAQLMQQLRERNLLYEFDFNASHDYSGMLQKQIEGKIDSWAICWYASAFIHNKLTLYPIPSLVENIGGDGSGTHAQNEKQSRTQLSDKRIVLKDIPVAESKLARKLISQQLFKHQGIRGRLKKILKWGY